ncbi:MAG: TetR/AcrR family transcriptional regulator [Pseudoclavibacter sp.]
MAIRSRTETKLLDAADELFFTAGIHATPIDAVLQRAGVSAATLYRGYASKEALVAAALERRHLAWLGVWDAEVSQHRDDEHRLLAVFDALDTFREQPVGARWCAFLGAASEYADAPPEVGAVVNADTETLRARLTELAGPFREPEVLADELLLLVTGYLAMRLRDARYSTATARRMAWAAVRAAAGGSGSRRDSA